MAFNEFPIPTERLDAKATVSSLATDEFFIVAVPAGVRRLAKSAAGFSRVFVSASTPGGTRVTNDIWVDSSDGNSFKVWNGAAWVERNYAGSAGSIPLTSLADISTDRILGRVSASSGQVEQLTATQARSLLNVQAGANNYVHPNHSGDVVSDGDGATTIQPSVVENSMLANANANTLKGNATGSADTPTDIAVGANEFLARASTGTLEVKDITDVALEFLADATEADMRETIGVNRAFLAENAGVLGVLFGADFNVTTDQPISMPVDNYIVEKIIVYNSSVDMDTAAGGIYTELSKGGTDLVGAAQVYTQLTDDTKYLSLSLESEAESDVLSGPLYLSLTTEQGEAATADVVVYGRILP